MSPERTTRNAVPWEDLEHVVAKTASLWDEVRGGRLFITGGTGFFGIWMTRSFLHANERLALGAEIVLLVRDQQRALSADPTLAGRPEVAFWTGDMESFVFPPGPFTHILHLATHRQQGAVPGEAVRTFRADVGGTGRVLEFAAACGARKVLFASSGSVYGRQPPELSHIPEDHSHEIDVLDPAAAYAMGKRASEFLCAQWGSAAGFEAKIARCFAFVGPWLPLDANFAVGNFIGDVIAGRPVAVRGDGTPFRSYLYAADLAAWLWTILFRGRHGRPYNTGSESAISILELARLVARAGNPDHPVRVLGSPVPGRLPPRYVPATARAREEMGLDAWVPLEEAIRRSLAWERARAL